MCRRSSRLTRSRKATHTPLPRWISRRFPPDQVKKVKGKPTNLIRKIEKPYLKKKVVRTDCATRDVEKMDFATRDAKMTEFTARKAKKMEFATKDAMDFAKSEDMDFAMREGFWTRKASRGLEVV